MKHRLAASAALVAAALSLAACAPDPLGDASPSPSTAIDPGASQAPAVTAVDAATALADFVWKDGAEGEGPTVTFTFPVDFLTTGSRLIADGDGEAITEGSLLTIDYVAYSGLTGEVVYSTYEAGEPESVQLDVSQFDEELLALLTSSHVGAQVLFGIPDQGTGSGSTIMAMTVAGVVPVLDRAEGAAVAPVAGLPVVTLSEAGAPSVAYDGATKPTTLVAQDLIAGTGPVVTQGQTLMVHYTGWVWEGDTPFDSSWTRGKPSGFPFVQGGLIQGWIDGLEGKTVGSQVLLVIPPDLGYGADGNGEAIPGDSTLVFVVDILAAS